MRPERYINTGAPFTSSGGQRIATGEEFTPTEDDLRRRRYKLRPVLPRYDELPSAELSMDVTDEPPPWDDALDADVSDEEE